MGPGWFVPAGVDGDRTDQRVVEAAVHLTAWGAVTGWAALHWQGARWFEGRTPSGALRPVPLVTGDAGIRPTSRHSVSEERLLPADLDVVDGLRVTVPLRSTLFEARHAPCLRDAFVALDMACASDLVSLEELAVHAALLGTWTGIPQVRAALALADENAWSPAEVPVRLLWVVDAALPRPATNRPLFDLDGRRFATPDLVDVEAGVVCEYDGVVHLDRGARRRDLRRDELYRRHRLRWWC